MILSGFSDNSRLTSSQLVKHLTQYSATASLNAYILDVCRRRAFEIDESSWLSSFNWRASSRPVPRLTTHPIGRPGQILSASAIASLVGLFHPMPPSPYFTWSIVMGKNTVGAAHVARAASQIVVENGNEVEVV